MNPSWTDLLQRVLKETAGIHRLYYPSEGWIRLTASNGKVYRIDTLTTEGEAREIIERVKRINGQCDCF